MCNTVDVGCAIEADGVVFHVGSHLGAGMDAGLERVVKAMKKVLDRCSDTTWLLMENSRRHGRHDRALDRRAGRDLRPARRPSAARRLPRLVPPVRVRLRRDGRGGARRDARRARRLDRPRPPARAARQRLGGAVRLEPRPAREHRRGADGQEARRVPAATRSSRACRPCSRCPGRTGTARTRAEVQATKKLHAPLRASKAKR